MVIEPRVEETGRCTPSRSPCTSPRNLLAVVDGAMQDKGLYPSSGGRTGFRRYVSAHPWITLGATCGAAGVVLDSL
jgi:hypothetical protein